MNHEPLTITADLSSNNQLFKIYTFIITYYIRYIFHLLSHYYNSWSYSSKWFAVVFTYHAVAHQFGVVEVSVDVYCQFGIVVCPFVFLVIIWLYRYAVVVFKDGVQ